MQLVLVQQPCRDDCDFIADVAIFTGQIKQLYETLLLFHYFG